MLRDSPSSSSALDLANGACAFPVAIWAQMEDAERECNLSSSATYAAMQCEHEKKKKKKKKSKSRGVVELYFIAKSVFMGIIVVFSHVGINPDNVGEYAIICAQ